MEAGTAGYPAVATPLPQPEHCDTAGAYLIGYSIVIPAICAFGVLGNTLNLLVLTHGRNHMKQSIYVYFTFLSVADLVTCLLVFFSGIAKGVASNNIWWQLFDVYLHLGGAAVSTTASITTIVMVTVERIIIIRNGRCVRWYCTRKTAWRVCWTIMSISIAFNIPYFLPFTVDKTDGIRPTWFYNSWYYQIHNWVRFVVFGVGAALFLAVGNILLILSVRRSYQHRKTLISQHKHWEERRVKEHSRLTATLIGIIVMFLLGEFPTHLASRQSAVTLIYSGDVSQLSSLGYHRLKLAVSLLMAVNYSCNFILYCALNSHFVSMLACVLRCRSARHARVSGASVQQPSRGRAGPRGPPAERGEGHAELSGPQLNGAPAERSAGLEEHNIQLDELG